MHIVTHNNKFSVEILIRPYGILYLVCVEKHQLIIGSLRTLVGAGIAQSV
jgi:hypothetical protein